MWIGKLIAGLLGYLVGGFFGGIVGVLIGHQFDRGLHGVLRPMSSQQRHLIQRVFFETVFRLLGHLAKADGRISEAEIQHTEQLMSGMGLTSEHRRQAIIFFKEGAAADFSLENALQRFQDVCAGHNNIRRMLLNYLISQALADGELHSAEESILRRVAEKMGFSAALFDQLLKMIRAQSRFRDYKASDPAAPGGSDQLASAYAALGVTPQSSDSEIKRAYRKLISENHPDKLIGQGVPADMVKLATERTQEIQRAYELIRSSRK